jgi:hypothetical protein
MIKFLSALLLLALISCTYKDSSPMSAIYRDHGPDPGQYDGSTGDTSQQWKQANFTSFELSLFSGLDTANLTNTQTPAELPNRQAPGYPNPFQHALFIATPFSLGPYDAVVAKYVVVDAAFRSVEARAYHITSSQSVLTIGANLHAGFYRVYVTFSASGNEHFLKYWGNIQKN